MKKLIQLACKISNGVTRIFDWCAPLYVLGIRFYFLPIFFWSGWLKITSWSSTLYLFKHEYKIVGMSPVVAAYIGTIAELVLPILLVLGVGARIPAIALFIFNIFNVLFYPAIWGSDCALKDHVLWGTLISVIIFYGHGKLSLDYWLQKKVCPEYRF